MLSVVVMIVSSTTVILMDREEIPMQHPDHDVNGDGLTRNDQLAMRRYATEYIICTVI